MNPTAKLHILVFGTQLVEHGRVHLQAHCRGGAVK